jgi:hypothetical protein
MTDLERALRGRVAALAALHNVPGVVVGVDLRGETFYACRGVTHVSHPLPVDPDTLFQIASNSEPSRRWCCSRGRGALGPRRARRVIARAAHARAALTTR